MWAVCFLFLAYSDGDLAKGELRAADAGKERGVSSNALGSPSCANSSARRLGPATSVGQELEDTSHAHTLRRAKRGFTYPGTLWCGAGNIADNYDQLGEFAETDECCRAHDYCPHVIHAFSSKYGFTNFKWHSISHCDCDNALKQCLRAVNDTSSRVVGQAFFNVIEAPCFEFSLEEQCVERHWYGVCKRYDKVPIAVMRESISYDFGGIEVIDVLSIAPLKKQISELDEGKQEEMQGSESMTQSSFSGSKNPAPEEPSLTNVVTAAEDFIKVLATVSTSQSSSTDGGKGETQTSEKKRKKNAGKKKKYLKKRRGKGKGKKRKQNAGKVSKAEESVAGAPSANRTEEVITKNNFVKDPGNFDGFSKNDNFMNSPFNSVGDGDHSNKMMRDEHQRTPDESQVGTTTAPNSKPKAEMLEPQRQIKDMESMQLYSPVLPAIASKPRATLRQRVAKKGQRHPTPTSFPVKVTLHNTRAYNTPVSTTESTSLAGLTAHTPISPPGEEVPHNVESWREKGSVFTATAQNTPIVVTKKLRLRQKGGRKRSRKLYSPFSPTDALTAEEPPVLLTDPTWELAVGSFSEPQSTSKRLQSNGPEIMAERSTTGVSGEMRFKKGQQRLKGTEDRKSSGRPNSDSSIMEDAIKARQETMAITITSTSTSSAMIDEETRAKDAEASTGQLLPSRLQTITPSTLTLKTRTTKRRRSKERAYNNRRKNKGTETYV